MNPPKIPMNSAGNLRQIPVESTRKFPLNFSVDSRFTYNPNFSGDSPPPRIHHPQGFPAESAWFCPLGLYQELIMWQRHIHSPRFVSWLYKRKAVFLIHEWSNSVILLLDCQGQHNLLIAHILLLLHQGGALKDFYSLVAPVSWIKL